jgi:acetyl-CoA carboxylase carboxyl transferase subunit alpha
MEFDEPILELKRRIEELSSIPPTRERKDELAKLKLRLVKVTEEIYANLEPWQIAQVARHPQRPYTLDYIERLTTDFVELHGDRRFADDPSIVAGFARFDGQPVAVLGQQKGRTTPEKIKRNFGMPHPEGYRKALRIMKMAERFHRPVLTFVDTPGAYPGIGAEERGQAEAIATNLVEMAALKVPVVVTIIGEGGSGGALAIAVGDRIQMLEYSIYSVISPEGCASILFKSAEPKLVREAAASLRLTAKDLLELKVIDTIVPEPPGGAHADPDQATENLRKFIAGALKELAEVPPEELVQRRYDKFRGMGIYAEG